MNQERIGKYIAKLRKGKKITQEELAEKLGVSSKSISRWETGRNMPDLSLITPLCKELGTTINELLSGEKLNEKEYQEKLEENIIKTIDFTDKKLRKTRRIFYSIIIIIVLFIITLITLFCIDVNRMRNNEPVFFSTWGFKYAPAIDFHDEEIEIAIENYLLEKSMSESKHHENEKTFVSIRTYLIEEKNNHKLYNVYTWVLEETYYLENNEIKQDSGSSIPYKFVVEHINDEYKVTDSRIPRDGSYYAEDMKNIFPRSVRNDMDEVHNDGTIEKLKMDIQKQVNLYFHK
jgi:transcriptional regulator with XRE-family HTH domain